LGRFFVTDYLKRLARKQSSTPLKKKRPRLPSRDRPEKYWKKELLGLGKRLFKLLASALLKSRSARSFQKKTSKVLSMPLLLKRLVVLLVADLTLLLLLGSRRFKKELIS